MGIRGGTSVADPSKYAEATITLVPVAVSISPTTATLYPTEPEQFTANVTNTSNRAVTWSVSSGPGTVNSSGYYTAPSSIPSQETAKVRATSVADTSKYAEATITLMPHP